MKATERSGTNQDDVLHEKLENTLDEIWRSSEAAEHKYACIDHLLTDLEKLIVLLEENGACPIKDFRFRGTKIWLQGQTVLEPIFPKLFELPRFQPPPQSKAMGAGGRYWNHGDTSRYQRPASYQSQEYNNDGRYEPSVGRPKHLVDQQTIGRLITTDKMRARNYRRRSQTIGLAQSFNLLPVDSKAGV